MNELIGAKPIAVIICRCLYWLFYWQIYESKGISLGVAAVLFTGLVFGALNTDLKIPSIITNLGLVLFVYSIGLKSGPAFFKSYKKNGLRDFNIYSGDVTIFWIGRRWFIFYDGLYLQL